MLPRLCASVLGVGQLAEVEAGPVERQGDAAGVVGPRQHLGAAAVVAAVDRRPQHLAVASRRRRSCPGRPTGRSRRGPPGPAGAARRVLGDGGLGVGAARRQWSKTWCCALETCCSPPVRTGRRTSSVPWQPAPRRPYFSGGSARWAAPGRCDGTEMAAAFCRTCSTVAAPLSTTPANGWAKMKASAAASGPTPHCAAACRSAGTWSSRPLAMPSLMITSRPASCARCERRRRPRSRSRLKVACTASNRPSAERLLQRLPLPRARERQPHAHALRP